MADLECAFGSPKAGHGSVISLFRGYWIVRRLLWINGVYFLWIPWMNFLGSCIFMMKIMYSFYKWGPECRYSFQPHLGKAIMRNSVNMDQSLNTNHSFDIIQFVQNLNENYTWDTNKSFPNMISYFYNKRYSVCVCDNAIWKRYCFFFIVFES